MGERKSSYQRGEANMNKKELFNAFDQRISEKSIVERNDEYVIEGKFCVITPMGENRWDVWICNSNDIDQGLDQRKVINIAANLFKSPCKSELTELTGEGWGVVAGTGIILQNLKLLGIKKKRMDSPESFEKMVKRLNDAKEVRPKRLATHPKGQSRSSLLAPELGLKGPLNEHNKGGSM
jgi:hypothetical protein